MSDTKLYFFLSIGLAAEIIAAEKQKLYEESEREKAESTALTLLLGDNANTISECTLRVFKRWFNRSLIDRKQLASTWFFDSKIEASRNAYSKSVLPSKSCRRRKDAFWTCSKRQMWSG